MVQVIWTNQARHDLEEIFHYYNTLSQEVAINYAEELICIFLQKNIFPHAHPIPQNFVENYFF